MTDFVERFSTLFSSNTMDMRQMAKIQLHAGSLEMIERGLVHARGSALAFVGGRVKIPRRVHMRAIVRAQFKHFDRPAFAIGQILFLKPQERTWRSAVTCFRGSSR